MPLGGRSVMRYFCQLRTVPLAGMACVVLFSQGTRGFATFKSASHGFSLDYPRSWYPHIASDIFSINNFPPSEAIRAVVLPKGGAGINVLTSTQAVRGAQKVPANLEDLAVLDNARQRIIGRRDLKIGDGKRTLSLIEVTTACCDPIQESVSWYFEVGTHMFVASVYYWQGEPKAEEFRGTLKEIVLSVKVADP